MTSWFKSAASRRSSANEPRDDDSVRESAERFRHEFEEHLKARAELLGIELREAGGFAARKSALGLLLAALLVSAYGLLLTAAVSLLGQWLASAWPDTFGAVGWQLVAVLFGVLHLLLARLIFMNLKRIPARPLFEYTRAELRKDRAWLKQKQSRKESDSSH
jgi:uncharacterized membrane protein YqjE